MTWVIARIVNKAEGGDSCVQGVEQIRDRYSVHLYKNIMEGLILLQRFYESINLATTIL